MLWAAPHSADPSANMTMKHKMTGLRPKTDTRPPTVGRTAVAAIAYALLAQMKSVPSRCAVIVGNAVDTAVCALM